MTIDAGLAEFQSTSSLTGEVNWEWVAQQFAERDRLREEKKELANALVAASYALRQVIAQFSSDENKINASVLPDSIDTLLARVNAKEK